LFAGKDSSFWSPLASLNRTTHECEHRDQAPTLHPHRLMTEATSNPISSQVRAASRTLFYGVL
jgi:hypothetical protein